MNERKVLITTTSIKCIFATCSIHLLVAINHARISREKTQLSIILLILEGYIRILEFEEVHDQFVQQE